MMPALIPQSVLDAAKTKDIREARERGWDLQVRGRIREHLEYFSDNYMEEGTYSKVIATKDTDYNVRFYTTREDFGRGLMAAALDIDYVKFKDTAKRFPWGKKYYDLLIKVWAASTMLAEPYGGRGFSYSSKRRRKGVGSSFLDEPVRERKKSVHEMTDDELEEMWNRA